MCFAVLMAALCQGLLSVALIDRVPDLLTVQSDLALDLLTAQSDFVLDLLMAQGDLALDLPLV